MQCVKCLSVIERTVYNSAAAYSVGTEAAVHENITAACKLSTQIHWLYMSSHSAHISKWGSEHDVFIWGL